jgi:hypothetical protein
MRLARAILAAALLLGVFVLLRRPAPGEHPQPTSASTAIAATPGQKALADRAEQKFASIRDNGARPAPDPAPTVLSEDEINAWLASGRLRLPAGVQRLRFQGAPGIITARSRIDFDELTASRRASNPLLGIFTGLHDVEVVAHARGEAATGYVDVDSVSLDGTPVPRMLLELFLDKYVAPRYPGVGMESRFHLPARIETAAVGLHRVTITQR